MILEIALNIYSVWTMCRAHQDTGLEADSAHTYEMPDVVVHELF
jgi:hypothetical protein